MADKTSKYPQNKSGPYYVDTNCIACDQCCYEAPGFFVMNDLDGHAYVDKQPLTPEEIEACENALSCCPVDAIGKDGETES